MARTKVKPQWIANSAARRLTFNKREKGLMKKVKELSTLCDIQACLVLYKPGQVQPVGVWTNIKGAKRVFYRYNKMPQTKQRRNTLNKEGFIRQQIDKMKDQLSKQDMENRNIEMNLFLSGWLVEGSLQGAHSITGLTCLAFIIEMRISQLRKRMEVVKERLKESPVDMEFSTEQQQGQDWFPPPGYWMGFFEQMLSERPRGHHISSGLPS